MKKEKSKFSKIIKWLVVIIGVIIIVPAFFQKEPQKQIVGLKATAIYNSKDKILILCNDSDENWYDLTYDKYVDGSVRKMVIKEIKYQKCVSIKFETNPSTLQLFVDLPGNRLGQQMIIVNSSDDLK